MRSILLLSLLLTGVAGCGDDTTSNAANDMAMTMVGPDMQLLSRCGHPGDTGNSKGVGKFCTNQGPDCGGNGMATLCSAITNGQTPSPDDTYFCTFTCTLSDPPDFCGENATCLCSGLGCACIPARCVTSTPDGGP